MSFNLENWLTGGKVSNEEFDDSVQVVAEGGLTEQPEVTEPVTEEVLETPTDPDAPTQTEEQLPEGEHVSTESEEPEITNEPFEQDDIGETVQYMNQVADDLDHLDNVGVALEAYAQLMEHAIENDGYINPTLASAIRIGMESLNEEATFGLIASNEDFTSPVDRFTVSTESLDNVKKRIQDVAKATGEVIAKLIRWLQDMWNSLTTATPKMRAAIDASRDKLKTVKSRNPKTMPIKGAARLSINGEFVGTTLPPIENLQKVGSYMSKGYMDMMLEVIKLVENEMKQIRAKGFLQRNAADTAATKLVMIISDNLRFNNIPATTQARDNEIPSPLKGYTSVLRSEYLIGNKAMYFAVKQLKAHQGYTVAAAKDLRGNMFDVRFDTAPNLKDGDSESQIKVPDQATIGRMLDGVESLVKLLEDYKESKAKGEKASKDLLAAFNSIARMETNFVTALGFNVITTGFVRVLTQPGGNYFGYVASTIKAYLAIIDRYIQHHTGGSFKAEGEVKEGEVIEGERAVRAPAVAGA